MDKQKNHEMMGEKCSHCGNTGNVIGKQTGYANIKANKHATLKEQPVYHVICLNCGTIIRSYVEKPEMLVIKK